MAKEVLDVKKLNLCEKRMQALLEPCHKNIIKVLIENKDMRVTDIIAHVNKPQPQVSNNLKSLCKMGFLTNRRSERNIYYSVNRKVLDSTIEIVEMLIK